MSFVLVTLHVAEVAGLILGVLLLKVQALKHLILICRTDHVTDCIRTYQQLSRKATVSNTFTDKSTQRHRAPLNRFMTIKQMKAQKAHKATARNSGAVQEVDGWLSSCPVFGAAQQKG